MAALAGFTLAIAGVVGYGCDSSSGRTTPDASRTVEWPGFEVVPPHVEHGVCNVVRWGPTPAGVAEVVLSVQQADPTNPNRYFNPSYFYVGTDVTSTEACLGISLDETAESRWGFFLHGYAANGSVVAHARVELPLSPPTGTLKVSQNQVEWGECVTVEWETTARYFTVAPVAQDIYGQDQVLFGPIRGPHVEEFCLIETVTFRVVAFDHYLDPMTPEVIAAGEELAAATVTVGPPPAPPACGSFTVATGEPDFHFGSEFWDFQRRTTLLHYDAPLFLRAATDDPVWMTVNQLYPVSFWLARKSGAVWEHDLSLRRHFYASWQEGLLGACVDRGWQSEWEPMVAWICAGDERARSVVCTESGCRVEDGETQTCLSSGPDVEE